VPLNIVDASEMHDSSLDKVFLEVPFSPIEVVAFKPKMRSADGKAMKDPSTGAPVHGKQRWFTFDNRRLHCLQRAALERWPRLCYVAVKVTAMASDDRKVLGKFKTTTEGESISIALAKSSAEDVVLWSWRSAFKEKFGDEAPYARHLAFVSSDELRSQPYRARAPGVSCQKPAVTPPLATAPPSVSSVKLGVTVSAMHSATGQQQTAIPAMLSSTPLHGAAWASYPTQAPQYFTTAPDLQHAGVAGYPWPHRALNNQQHSQRRAPGAHRGAANTQFVASVGPSVAKSQGKGNYWHGGGGYVGRSQRIVQR